ncbi:MogA/MoaB family molybdenum cofactor biosynthesis protein [Thermus filiformis]|uniref:Molybdenum cofactor synthesis protein n=1 Tax=Thermus filiformis TaxID=276 RepID=A0A0A2WR47_THEFI|nr:MogA/MoaB family molybdenum cofactor biosynthesis protein [Thermus filiformis]KGQ21212.1 molybdenum cofactor synthesis protein [Thermus filiformis]
MFRVGILTVSDKGARGEREDTTHLAIREVLKGGPFEVVAYEIVPDEPPQIKKVLRIWADRERLDLILTNGGTGLAPRDQTPEATREVLDREAPGLAELMRLKGLAKTPMAALSRGVAGVRGKTLILNLPGSPKGARDSLEAVLPVLPHALSLITGRPWKEGHHE